MTEGLETGDHNAHLDRIQGPSEPDRENLERAALIYNRWDQAVDAWCGFVCEGAVPQCDHGRYDDLDDGEDHSERMQKQSMLQLEIDALHRQLLVTITCCLLRRSSPATADLILKRVNSPEELVTLLTREGEKG